MECGIEQSAGLTGQLTKKLRSPKACFRSNLSSKDIKPTPAFESKWLDAKAPWGRDLRSEQSLPSKLRISDTISDSQTISDYIRSSRSKRDRNEFGFSWIWLELAKLCGKHWKTMPLKGIDLHAFHGNSQPQPKAQRSSWESTSCWGSFRASPALFLLMYPHCQLQCFQSSQRIQVLEHAQVL